MQEARLPGADRKLPARPDTPSGRRRRRRKQARWKVATGGNTSATGRRIFPRHNTPRRTPRAKAKPGEFFPAACGEVVKHHVLAASNQAAAKPMGASPT